jgi:hypothetical protein
VCKFEEYVDFLKEQLSFDITKGINKKKDGNISYFINSQAGNVFTELRKKWYPNGIKIVPKDIEINKTVLLHWYLGDGTLNNQVGVILCTDCFSKEDNLFLIDKLNQYDLEVYLKKDNNRIVIPNKRVFEFFNLIGVSPVICYNHKWDTLVSESYLGRSCNYCGKKFNTEYNHKKYCSDNCQKKQWKINKDKNYI